jgi:hypothetical protein
MAASAPTESRRSLSDRSRRIVLVLGCITVIAIVIAVVMAALEIDNDTLWYEIGALVAQAGILAGFGAAVTLLTHEYQQDQEESRQRSDERNQRIAARHEWLREFAIHVTDAYAEAKQARRRLQWAFDKSMDNLSASVYDKQLTKISAVQSRFETLHAMADTSLVSDKHRAGVTDLLKRIDDALSDLVSERKDHRVEASEEQVSLANRPKMRAFVAESETKELFESDDGFRNVKDAYKEVLAWIIAELQDAPAPSAPAVSRTPTATS